MTQKIWVFRYRHILVDWFNPRLLGLIRQASGIVTSRGLNKLRDPAKNGVSKDG